MRNAIHEAESRYSSRQFHVRASAATDFIGLRDEALEGENSGLRNLLTQAGVDVSRLLAQIRVDASKSEASEQLHQLLLGEAHHRLKNTLTTVMAIVSQTLRSARSLEDGQVAVENRLVALGKAHDLLLQANWASATLADVIHAAIEPFDSHEAPRFVVHGAPIKLAPDAILPLTMSLNELCTNAVKHGALSNSTGHIEITSTVDETTRRLKLTWIEVDGPAVQKPARRSFGTRLIGRLADQLHGEARLSYLPAGLVYELDVPQRAAA